MVRLGEVKEVLDDFSIVTFQFQYGTIGGLKFRETLTDDAEFQFQYGTIGGGFCSYGMNDMI
ncbi:MAG: hypothetical protein ACK4VN_16825, partial [Bacteroidales bacterium]